MFYIIEFHPILNRQKEKKELVYSFVRRDSYLDHKIDGDTVW